jgi:RP/EB family microtubule-associated protein
MHPGKIPMQRVNFKANNEWQFISNFKILQQGFAKCKILKYIDV